MSWYEIVQPSAGASGLSVGKFGCAEMHRLMIGCRHVEELAELTTSAELGTGISNFGAVIIDNLTSATLHTADQLDELVKRNCGKQCVIVVIGQCGQVLPRLIRSLRGGAGNENLAMSVVRRTLVQNQFADCRFYYALPGAGFGDEFRASTADNSLQRRVGFIAALRKFLRRILIGRNCIIVAARHSTPFASVQSIVKNISNDDECEMLIDSIAIRSRGSTVFSGRISSDGSPIILKAMETGPNSKSAIESIQFLEQLHNTESPDNRWRNLIPRSLSLNQGEAITITVEEKAPGNLAWKTPIIQSDSGPLVIEALRFLFDLGCATARTETIYIDAYNRLIGDDLNILKKLPSNTASMEDCLAEISAILSKQLFGRRCSIVWGHGDFGLGNILCDEGTGHITGIIDWDTCSTFELPMVDGMNLLIQMYRRPNLLTSLKTLAETETLDWKMMEEHFELCKSRFVMASNDVLFFLAFSILRLLARDQGYSGSSLTDDQCEALRYCLRLFNKTIPAN